MKFFCSPDSSLINGFKGFVLVDIKRSGIRHSKQMKVILGPSRHHQTIGHKFIYCIVIFVKAFSFEREVLLKEVCIDGPKTIICDIHSII